MTRLAISVALAIGLMACSSDMKDNKMEMNSEPVMEQEDMMEAGNTSDMTSTYSCGNSDHPSVGQLAILDTYHHDVAGQVLVKDNCTLEVTSFTYDGQGPAVYFYGGLDGDYQDAGFAIGEQLNGMVYSNETLTITLDSPARLDAMNGISVWCVDFSVSFGDGLFM